MENELNKYLIDDIVNIVLLYTKQRCLICKIEVGGYGNCEECKFKVWQFQKCMDVYSENNEYDRIKKKLKHCKKYKRCLHNFKIEYTNYGNRYSDSSKYYGMLGNGDDLKYLMMRYDTHWDLMENDIKNSQLQFEINKRCNEQEKIKKKDYYDKKKKIDEMFKKWENTNSFKNGYQMKRIGNGKLIKVLK